MEGNSRVMHPDLLIIGGGPAGLSAGIEATGLGVSVLLIDDKETCGGQLVKQTHMFFGSKQERAGVRGIDIATELTHTYTQLGGHLMTETMAVGIFEDGVVGAVHNCRGSQVWPSPPGTEFIRILPRKIVIATGAYENMLPFPNCDLPGVYGAGGFQTLMNVGGVLPGKKVLMVGAGNIGLIVSYQLMQAGGEVVAVVEAEPRVGGYGVHAAKIRRMGVPILLSHTVKRVLGKDRVEAATIVKLDNYREVAGTEFTVEADTVCLSVGLAPLAELFFAARCRMVYVPALGGHVPYHDENMMTSNENIFVAGDASGIEEASAAMIEGKIAGTTAAGAIMDKDVEHLLAGHKAQLEALRGGPYGKKARQGKAELWGISKPTEPDSPPAPASEQGEPFTHGKRAVIECAECIPCNPCEEACKFGAIQIGPNIANAPRFAPALCSACGLCLTRCPGLAIFMVDMDYARDLAEVTIPYELFPIPKKGETWTALDRDGLPVGPAQVTRVVSAKSFDRKSLVSFAVSKNLAHKARHIAPQAPEPAGHKRADEQPTPDNDPIICRCEDVRRSTLEQLIDHGYHTFNELKRFTRVGMGPCQGKACQRIILQMLARKLAKPMSEFAPMTVRSPLRPVPFDTMAAVELKENDSPRMDTDTHG